MKKDFVEILNKIKRKLLPIFYIFKSPNNPPADRYSYQKKYIKHKFKSDELILDIGSGSYPFPHAGILADRYLHPTQHLSEDFKFNGKPVVICDINALPFSDKQFDYVVCSHILEHVINPMIACNELIRVGKSGLIETPTFMKDALFSWATGMHKWYVIVISNRILFLEYNERQLKGVGDNNWYEVIFGNNFHPLQESFNKNQDIFNNIFEWENNFEIMVLSLNGKVELKST